jgi:L-threonylcarbamoyladenylate synthase
MLASHYSPRCKILLAENSREASEILDGLPAGRSGLIELVEPVSMYAATLYASLRACDEHGWTHAVAVLPPRVGLGRAIRDRLERAASPSAG